MYLPKLQHGDIVVWCQVPETRKDLIEYIASIKANHYAMIEPLSQIAVWDKSMYYTAHDPQQNPDRSPAERRRAPRMIIDGWVMVEPIYGTRQIGSLRHNQLVKIPMDLFIMIAEHARWGVIRP